MFLADYTNTGLSFPQAKCFDLIFDESVCSVMYSKRKAFLHSIQKICYTLLPSKRTTLVKIVKCEAIRKKRKINIVKKNEKLFTST